jgi:DNA repair protein RadA/Sms
MNEKLSTGSKNIDRLIEGGISLGELFLIYGGRGSGRTTLAFQIIINNTLKGRKSLLIFTGENASLMRLKIMARDKWSEISEKILVINIKSFKEQDDLIDNLELFVFEDLNLIVFDSITSFYRLELKGRENENIMLNKQLNRELALLKYNSMKKGLYTILTSDITIRPGEKFPIPVASQILTYWCDKIIRIDRLQENIRKVVLIKPQMDISCLVRISENGIDDI